MNTKLSPVVGPYTRDVDTLGDLRAQRKALDDRIAEIERTLKASGLTDIDGVYYHVAVAYGVTRKTTDWKAVAEKFNPSRQLVQAHTKGFTFDQVRVTAHKK